jgi:predicted transposase/invertase (TIGR01784 family)
MRTDTLFYQLFQKFPSLIFELIGLEVQAEYSFISVEVKERAFRFDGIFMPTSLSKLIYFLEIQFQPKSDFYWEFLSEIFLFLNQQKPIQDWKAVAIFGNRKLDVKALTPIQSELIASGRIIRIYLDELPKSTSIGVNIARLITFPSDEQIVKVSIAAMDLASLPADVVSFIETVLVYKFPKLSRKEIEEMFTLDDLRQTRVYQEAQQDEARRLILLLLKKRFKDLTDRQVELISALDLFQLENLGEAFLDFSSDNDLDAWLDSQLKPTR